MAYDDKRWNAAWLRWQAYLRSGTREPFPGEDTECIEFRNCPGCGIEFILTSFSRQVHYESLNPHAICDGCSRERMRLYPLPKVLTAAEKSREEYFGLDKHRVLKDLRRRARTGETSGLRMLLDASAWRTRMAAGHSSGLGGYDSARHEAAIRIWLRRYPQVGQNSTRAVHTISDILAIYDVESYEYPERLEFRRCHGCGGGHILRREHVLLYPHPCDPRPLCSNCEPGFERTRALASNYTNEGPFREPIPSVLDALPADQQSAISGKSVVLEHALN